MWFSLLFSIDTLIRIFQPNNAPPNSAWVTERFWQESNVTDRTCAIYQNHLINGPQRIQETLDDIS